MKDKILLKANKNIEELIKKYIELVKRSESICDYVVDEGNCVKYTCEQCYEYHCNALAGDMMIKYCLNEKDFEEGAE